MIIDSEKFKEILSYTDEVPISIRRLEALPGSAEQDQFTESNETLLRAENAIQEHVLESEEYAELAPEFARLDQKMNLILELLGTLVAGQTRFPPPRLMRLASTCVGIALTERDPGLSSGDKMELDVYIDPDVPKPLKFFGEVADIDPEYVVISFMGLSSTMEMALQKLVFRHHRREIAQRSIPGDQ